MNTSAASLSVRPSERARVLIVDDHPIYRDGLRRAVHADPRLQMMAVCESGEEALCRLTSVEIDVVLTCYSLPGINGAAVAAAIRRSALATGVVVLADGPDAARAARSLAAEATVFLTKQADHHEICECACRVAGVTDSELAGAPAPGAPALLSARETELLVLMAHGSSALQIGDALYVSTATVRTHQRHIYDKLHVRCAAAAVFQAICRGLLQADGRPSC